MPLSYDIVGLQSPTILASYTSRLWLKGGDCREWPKSGTSDPCSTMKMGTMAGGTSVREHCFPLVDQMPIEATNIHVTATLERLTTSRLADADDKLEWASVRSGGLNCRNYGRVCLNACCIHLSYLWLVGSSSDSSFMNFVQISSSGYSFEQFRCLKQELLHCLEIMHIKSFSGTWNSFTLSQAPSSLLLTIKEEKGLQDSVNLISAVVILNSW